MTEPRQGSWGAAAFFFALSMSGAAGAQKAAPTADHPWIGKPAPPIELPSSSGETVSLSSFTGKKLVVLHFAASW